MKRVAAGVAAITVPLSGRANAEAAFPLTGKAARDWRQWQRRDWPSFLHRREDRFNAAKAATEPLPHLMVVLADQQRRTAMKGILAWVIGIPIPIIILLYLFDVF